MSSWRPKREGERSHQQSQGTRSHLLLLSRGPAHKCLSQGLGPKDLLPALPVVCTKTKLG